MASSIPASASPQGASAIKAPPRRRNYGGAVGLVIIALVILMAILAPVLSAYAPNAQDLFSRLKPPGFVPPAGGPPHWLGTDQLGRDIWARVLYSARISLFIGIISVSLTAVVGTLLGLMAGFYRGVVETVIMRLVDLLLGVPFILLALAVIGITGPGLQNLILVIVATRWVQYARILFGQVLSTAERDFVEAAHALGSKPFRILIKHILPNVAPTTIVLATLDLGFVIILESGLSFLGLGVSPSTPTWGMMLAEGRAYLNNAWWLGTWPGVAIMITVLGFNLLGDWARDKLDPTLRR
ncbi:MAG TPA: ABC transporter permease [Symbiobacteriaceae bacterium]|nr:ABC transporter permease [Symbiobacteriaceae bacterium]